MAWAEATSQVQTSIPFVKICIPHYGNVTLEWARRMLMPLEALPQPDFEKQTLLMRGIQNLDTERNELVKSALQDAKTTHILFVDTDTLPENPQDPNQALRMLLACNAPIASGLYRAKQKTGFHYAMWLKNPSGEGYVPAESWTPSCNWIKADVIGLGFCLIKREVFERVPPPWFVWDKPAPSEDFAWCEKVKQYGYEVRVLTDVRLSHIGTLKVLTTGQITTLEV
jgi:hypothetical protein